MAGSEILLDSPIPDQIYMALDVLTGLFDRVGIQNNTKITVGMVCQPCHIFGKHSEVEYTWRMKGLGQPFRSNSRRNFGAWRAIWSWRWGFWKPISRTSIGMTPPPPQWVTPQAMPDPRLYRVYSPRATRSIGCPVEGCKGLETTCINLQIHFVHCHMRDMVVIMEEGKISHPR